jgi:hypothetical protein
MKISKIHQEFSEQLNDPRALTHPEDFLGPNWKDVINFWLYVDGLSVKERKKINRRYFLLEFSSRIYWDSVYAAKKVVGNKVLCAAGDAAYCETGRVIFRDATHELMVHHKLLEQGKSPTFLPLCLNP